MSIVLKAFKKYSEGEIHLTWSDGHRGPVALALLRDSCPCAGCQGETVLLHTYKPLATADKPGKYILKGAEMVGRYALQLRWGDGHNDGLFTWEYLRSLCQCPECTRGRSQEGTG
jgi:DUF971 family protein